MIDSYHETQTPTIAWFLFFALIGFVHSMYYAWLIVRQVMRDIYFFRLFLHRTFVDVEHLLRNIG